MSDKRQQYRNVIELFFSTVNDMKITKRNKSGFFFIQKGEEKSVFTELGYSQSTFFYLPSEYNGKEVSLRGARTDYYCIIFPEEQVICLGRPKKLRLYLDSGKSRWEEVTAKNGVKYTKIDRKFLEELFDKIYEVGEEA